MTRKLLEELAWYAVPVAMFMAPSSTRLERPPSCVLHLGRPLTGQCR